VFWEKLHGVSFTDFSKHFVIWVYLLLKPCLS